MRHVIDSYLVRDDLLLRNNILLQLLYQASFCRAFSHIFDALFCEYGEALQILMNYFAFIEETT